jgi:hypothetical protein
LEDCLERVNALSRCRGIIGPAREEVDQLTGQAVRISVPMPKAGAKGGQPPGELGEQMNHGVRPSVRRRVLDHRYPEEQPPE